MAEKKKPAKRRMITVAAQDEKSGDEIRRYLKMLSAIRGENQGVVLLEALKEYHKKIGQKF